MILSAAQLRKFERRAPGQHRAPEFYWRGGDVLKEQETLRDERRDALAALRRAEARLAGATQDAAEAAALLAHREGYTAALGAFVDADVSGAARESELKRYLAGLERRIFEGAGRLEELRRVQNPAVVAQVQKELASYLVQIQQTEKTRRNYVDKQVEAKRQIAACTVHARYREALLLAHRLAYVRAKNTRMRVLVAAAKIAFEELRPALAPVDAASRAERARLKAGQANHVTRVRNEERVAARPRKQRGQIEHFLRQIEELNDRLRDIGLGDAAVDTAALRAQVLPRRDAAPPPAGTGASEAAREEQAAKSALLEAAADLIDEIEAAEEARDEADAAGGAAREPQPPADERAERATEQEEENAPDAEPFAPEEEREPDEEPPDRERPEEERAEEKAEEEEGAPDAEPFDLEEPPDHERAEEERETDEGTPEDGFGESEDTDNAEAGGAGEDAAFPLAEADDDDQGGEAFDDEDA
jgi:hypothetical protein